jgi:hypothetical protein
MDDHRHKSSNFIWLRRLFVWPLLTLLGFHTLLTGSPILLWHIEKLDRPVAVKELASDHLVLEDRRKIRLPLISSMPSTNVLFLAAVREGVEVQDDGEVFGLLWIDRSCGNDPCVWLRKRINLSELAAGLYPDGIDSSIVHPEAIRFLAEADRIELRPSHPERLKDYSLSHLRQIRRQFDHSLAVLNRSESNPRLAIPLP